MKVCVVGAGLAGLAVAAATGRDGTDVTVLERKASIEPLGGGLILQPNAVRALDELGCLGAVRRTGVELTQLVQHRNGAPIEIALSEVWPRLRLPTIALHRHAIHAVLLGLASQRASIELSQEAKAVTRSATGRPLVGTGDGQEREFDLVVGADGIHSRIRTELAPSSEVRELGLWWARWLVEAGSPLARRWQTERVGNVGVGTFPLGGGQLQVFATIPNADMVDGRREETLDTLLRRSEMLRRAEKHGMQLVHVGPAREVWPHVWGGDGFVFAGDAAHAMPPTLSAGGGLAIEDGLVLGRLLGEMRRASEITERYEELRRERLRWMAKVGKVQMSTVQGSPSPPSGPQLAANMRSMYGPLDDPSYLTAALT